MDDIVKQLRYVTGRPTQCTPKITSAAEDEIERLRNGLEMLLVHDDWERPPEPDLVEAVKNILSRK